MTAPPRSAVVDLVAARAERCLRLGLGTFAYATFAVFAFLVWREGERASDGWGLWWVLSGGLCLLVGTALGSVGAVLRSQAELAGWVERAKTPAVPGVDHYR